MIASLRIENFALIDEVHIQFTKGFTVITGETGSGKSILLNALNLILGERANFSVIGDRKDKSIVEAQIQIADFDLKSFLRKKNWITSITALFVVKFQSKDAPERLSMIHRFNFQR